MKNETEKKNHLQMVYDKLTTFLVEVKGYDPSIFHKLEDHEDLM